jgi:hypothetical protein
MAIKLSSGKEGDSPTGTTSSSLSDAIKGYRQFLRRGIMNKIIFTTILLVASGMVQAEMVKHEYAVSVECKMPVDSAESTEDECIVKKDFYETGVKIEKQGGGICSQTTRTLVKIEKYRHGNQEMELPEVNAVMKMGKCEDFGVK